MVLQRRVTTPNITPKTNLLAIISLKENTLFKLKFDRKTRLPHTWGPVAQFCNQPDRIFPPIFSHNLNDTTTLEKLFPNLHNHFPNNALLIVRIDEIPRPPQVIGWQTWFQLTKGYFLFSFDSYHRKSHWNFSNLFAQLKAFKARKVIDRNTGN